MVNGTQDLSLPLHVYGNTKDLDVLFARMTKYIGMCVQHFTREDTDENSHEQDIGFEPKDIGVDCTNLLIYCTNGRTRSIVIALGVLKVLQSEYDFDAELEKMAARFQARELLKDQWSKRYQNFRMMDKDKIKEYQTFIEGLSSNNI